MLMLSQKNWLFDEIEKLGLSPMNFDLHEEDGCFQLRFSNTDYYLDIQNGDRWLYKANWSPGLQYFAAEHKSDEWDSIQKCITQWIQNLIRETNQDDKWKRFFDEIGNLEINSETSNKESNNERFSALEYKQLKIDIDIIKDGLASIPFEKNQYNVILAKLDHLREMAEEMNKFDWKSLFIGTLISIIIQLSVNQDNAKALWQLIKSAFNNYFLPVFQLP